MPRKQPRETWRRRLRPGGEYLEDRRLLTTLPAGFVEVPVASGLARPTAMEFAPDGRLFVAQQGGQLRVIKGGQLLPTPFVSLNVDSTGERGLLGVAFDPQFASNHFVYVYYTVPGSPAHNRVSRFTAAGDVAQPGSEVPILNLDSLSAATNHNGGAIHFGRDGKLYVGVGENGNGANAQTLNNRLGKLLRINPDGTIPADNPFFATATGPNRAIWALGLRNPFTFAVQPGTGRIFIDDVGQNTWEEIDEGVAGANYGWPTTEGPTTDPRFRGPIYAYMHGPNGMNGCAIVGGTFYNPVQVQFPSDSVGDYFFTDLCGSYIRRFDPATGVVDTIATGLPVAMVDMKVAADGSLYYAAQGTGPNTGVVVAIQFRAAPPPVIQPPVVTRDPQTQFAALGQPATLSVAATGTGPLFYQWQRNGVAISTEPVLTIPAVTPSDLNAHFRVVVLNAGGVAVSRDAALIDATPYVRSVIVDLLHRPPDPFFTAIGGLILARGASPFQLVQAFQANAERRQSTVIESYVHFLRRVPTFAELQAGIGRLNAGGSADDVQASILGSADYFARQGNTGRGFLTGLYRDVLGRDPTAAELRSVSNRPDAPTREAIARQLLVGDEARSRLVAAWYLAYLGRPASPVELSIWVGRFRGGFQRDQVEASIVASPEALLRAYTNPV